MTPGRDVKALLDAVGPAVEKGCVDDTSRAIGYFGVADAVLRMRDACADVGDALVGLAAPDGALASGASGRCGRIVAGALSRLRSQTIAMSFGPALRSGCMRRSSRRKQARPKIATAGGNESAVAPRS